MKIVFTQLLFDITDAWTALRRRPLRSALSSIGIGIGVAALVAMLSIGEGAKRQVLSKIASLGAHTLRLENNVNRQALQDRSVLNLSPGLTMADTSQLAAWLGPAARIGAYARQDDVLLTAGSRTVAATVMAVNGAWYGAEDVQLGWGRLPAAGDIGQSRAVCIAGSGIARKLGLQPYAEIRLGNHPFTTVGIMSPRGSLLTEGTGLSALDFDNAVIIPLPVSPFIRQSGGSLLLDGLVVKLDHLGEAEIFSNAERVKQILLTSHRGIETFRLVVPLSLLKEARDSQKLFSLVMGSIAGLSLLVGGIGVMNVMFANISEQTREIGLRMSLGATGARIVCLYLLNALLLSATGAAWGIGGGMLLATLVQQYAAWQTAFSPLSLVAAPSSALLTGLLFGLHPALRAASMEPALALRDS